MRRAKGAADQLVRLLGAELERLGASVQVEAMESRSWASITFAGARHRLGLRLEGEKAAPAADAFLAGLADQDVELRGHLLADLSLLEDERVDGGPVRLSLEALTVEVR